MYNKMYNKMRKKKYKKFKYIKKIIIIIFF